MIINLLCFAAGFIVCLCLPNTKYKKLKAEFDEFKENVKDKVEDVLDKDDDKKEPVKEEEKPKDESPKAEEPKEEKKVESSDKEVEDKASE